MHGSGSTRAMWAAVAIGLGLGLVLFLHGLATQVAPYSPRYFDQLSGYFALYRSHAVLTDPTQGVAQRLAAAAPLLLDQRGWSVPLVATGLGLVFGASRLAFAATNYVFLAAIVAALAAALSHRFGVWAAAAGIGLLLTSRSLYLVTGGLHDLRMDLAGLATFGIFVLALWGMAEAPDRRHVALAALAYAVTTWSRSVTGVYGLGAIGLFWAVSLAAALRVGGPCWSRRWRAAFALGLAASAIFALFAGLHLEALDNYYGNLLRSDELRIRLAEFGVSSRAGLLGYFLASGWDHLRPLVLWAGVALAALAVLSAAGRWLRPAPPLTVTAPRPAATPALLTVGAAVVGTLVPLSLFSPSPVVIGVLTVPLALLGATALARAAAAVPWPRAAHLALLVPLAAGLWTCGRQLAWPPVWAAHELPAAQAQNAMLDAIAADGGGRVAWLQVTEAANAAGFEVRLFETGRAALAPRFTHEQIAIFALTPAAILTMIDAADALVTWETPPPRIVYPSEASMRDARAAWQPVVARDFALRAAFPLAGGTLAYYRRIAGRS